MLQLWHGVQENKHTRILQKTAFKQQQHTRFTAYYPCKARRFSSADQVHMQMLDD